MAENTQIQDPEQVKAAEENERFKKRLRDEYGIEDDADSFKEKRNRWARAEEEIPQYQATLNAIVAHYRSQEEAAAKAPVRPSADTDSEEELRNISKLDPLEGTKRYFAKKEKEFDAKIEAAKEEGRNVAQRTTLERETMRRSKEIVEQNWPEAFDEKSELFKMGHRIYNQEMSESEKRDPRSFLIATERAAGRIGLAPKGRRSGANRRADAAAQSVSRSAARPPSEDDNEAPLTARQKKIIEGLGVDEKTYRAARKNRKEQGNKKQDDE